MDTLIVKLPLDLSQIKGDLPKYAAALVRELEKAIYDLSLRDVDINTALATTQAALATAEGDIDDLESAVSGLVSNDAYGSGWNGVEDIAPSQNALYDKIATLMLLTGANLAIGSDADGDMYYRASGVLARLAKGTANHKLFTNAGGTAPEWASGLYTGYITRGMTDTGAPTDVNYTGLPFKPSALIFIMSLGNASLSVGIADASNSYVQVVFGAATTYYQPNGTTCIWIVESSGKEQKASLKTFNSDGFTLTWTKVGSPATATCYGYYIAIR